MPEEETLREANATYWTDLQDDDAHARALYAAQAHYRMRYLRDRIGDLHAMRILDIGAGQGHAFDSLRRGAGRGAYTAVEADPRMRREMQSRGVPHVAASLEDVPAGDFDLVILSHVIEHMRDPVDGVRCAVRKLKPGGAVFVEVPNRDDRYKKDLGPHLFVFACESLDRMFALLGMPVVDLVTCGFPVTREEEAKDEVHGDGARGWIKRHVPGALAVKRRAEAALLRSRFGRARFDARYGFTAHATEGRWLRCIARI
jgi:SAM-dependent methyltransferase